MTKEKLQEMYNEMGEEALKLRDEYRELREMRRELKAVISKIESRLGKIASEGAHYEAIVFHSIKAGATDTKGWLDNEGEGVEDEEEYDEEDEEEDEDYPECSGYDCKGCPRIDYCSHWD